MRDFIIKRASGATVKRSLKQYIRNENEIERFFEEIIQQSPDLGGDNEITEIGNKSISGPFLLGLQIEIGESMYFINLKYTTIIMLAFLLDIKIKSSIPSLILVLFGKRIQVFFKLKENERCVLRYILHMKNELIEITDFLKEKTCKCMDLKCYLRSNECCRYDRDLLEKVTENLLNKKVIRKKNGFYKIAF